MKQRHGECGSAGERSARGRISPRRSPGGARVASLEISGCPRAWMTSARQPQHSADSCAVRRLARVKDSLTLGAVGRCGRAHPRVLRGRRCRRTAGRCRSSSGGPEHGSWRPPRWDNIHTSAGLPCSPRPHIRRRHSPRRGPRVPRRRSLRRLLERSCTGRPRCSPRRPRRRHHPTRTARRLRPPRSPSIGQGQRAFVESGGRDWTQGRLRRASVRRGQGVAQPRPCLLTSPNNA